MRSLRKFVFSVNCTLRYTDFACALALANNRAARQNYFTPFFVNTLWHVFVISYLLIYAYAYRHFVRSVCQPILDDKRSGNSQDNPSRSHHYGRDKLHRAILNRQIENIKMIKFAWVQSSGILKKYIYLRKQSI